LEGWSWGAWRVPPGFAPPDAVRLTWSIVGPRSGSRRSAKLSMIARVELIPTWMPRLFSSLRSDGVAAVAEAAQWDRKELRFGLRLLPVVRVGGRLQLAGRLAVLTLRVVVELASPPLPPSFGVIEPAEQGIDPCGILGLLALLAEALPPANAVRTVRPAGAKPRGI
jgi:hypothetical protein